MNEQITRLQNWSFSHGQRGRQDAASLPNEPRAGQSQDDPANGRPDHLLSHYLFPIALSRNGLFEAEKRERSRLTNGRCRAPGSPA